MTRRKKFKSQRGAPLREEIENMAADWIARRDAGLAADEEATFRQWVSADLRHAQAVSELEAAWATLNEPRLSGGGPSVMRDIRTLETQALRRRQTGRYAIGATLMALAATLLVVFFRTSPDAAPPVNGARTVELRPDRRLLPDGSVIELNAGADVVVKFSAAKREVRLVRGEALFSVAKDPARPFVVHAGEVEVRAIGTAFSVLYEQTKAVNVLVTEGHVAVQRVSDGESLIAGGQPGQIRLPTPMLPSYAPPVLTAGHRMVIPVIDMPTPSLPVAVTSKDEIVTALAWRQRRVEFTSTPLAEAVPLFNRENQSQLALANAATAELQISGVFWTDDPDGFARLLESSLGIKADRGTRDIIVLRK